MMGHDEISFGVIWHGEVCHGGIRFDTVCLVWSGEIWSGRARFDAIR